MAHFPGAAYGPGGDREMLESQALTVKELGFIEECIKSEALCATKAQAFEREVHDGELREFCHECVQSANRHIEELLALLS